MRTKPNGGGQKARRAGPNSRPAEQDQPPKDDTPPFIDLLKALIEPGSALAEFHARALKQCLEPWVIFLRAYRETLDERTANLSPEDRSRRFAKALMAAYIEAVKSAPAHSPLLAAQREVVDAWLRTAESLLRSSRPASR